MALLPANISVAPASAEDPKLGGPVVTGPEVAPDGTVAVVDPMSRKIAIPRGALRETLALSRAGTPSLCILFLRGRCRQGTQCHQVHAEPETVFRLREDARKLPTCCAEHSDINAGMLKAEWRARNIEVNGVVIEAKNLAYTVGLKKIFSDNPDGTVRIPVPTVCRLHVTERCRYSEDCKFIHVCRQETSKKLAAWVQPMIPQLELRHGETQANAAAAAAGGQRASHAQQQLPPQMPAAWGMNSLRPQQGVALVPPPQTMNPMFFMGQPTPNSNGQQQQQPMLFAPMMPQQGSDGQQMMPMMLVPIQPGAQVGVPMADAFGTQFHFQPHQ